MVEMEFGHVPQAEAHCQFVAEVGAGVLESGQRFALFPLGSTDRDAHVGMTPIRRHMHFGDVNGQEPWIIGLETDDFGKLLAYRLRDP